MFHIINVRTYNNTKLLKRFLDNFFDVIRISKIKKKIVLIIVDDSNNHIHFKKNRVLLNKYRSENTRIYYFKTKSENKDELLGILKANFPRTYTSLIKIFTSNYSSPESISKKNKLRNVGDTHATKVFQQLASLIICQKLNLKLSKCILSFYDDDIILKTIKEHNNRFDIIMHDYFDFRQKAFSKGHILSYGKYIHHHGNPLVTLERDLNAILQILENNFILTNSKLKSSLLIYLNKRYKILDNRRLLKLFPKIIKTKFQRSSIINPIMPSHYDLFDKKQLSFDEGNYSIRGDIVYKVPILPFPSGGLIYKRLLMITIKNLTKRILVEAPVIHIREKKLTSRSYIKKYKLSNIINSMPVNLKDPICTVIKNTPSKYSNYISKYFNQKNVSEQKVVRLFCSKLERDQKRNDYIKNTFERIKLIRQRYKNYLNKNILKSLDRLEDFIDIDPTKKSSHIEYDYAEKMIDTYFTLHVPTWNKILSLNWKKLLTSKRIN